MPVPKASARRGPVKKFAISVPEDVMEQVDCAASERGLTRSGFIVRVLRRVAGARSDAEVAKRINALFEHESVAAEQRSTAALFRSIQPHEGTEW